MAPSVIRPWSKEQAHRMWRKPPADEAIPEGRLPAKPEAAPAVVAVKDESALYRGRALKAGFGAMQRRKVHKVEESQRRSEAKKVWGLSGSTDPKLVAKDGAVLPPEGDSKATVSAASLGGGKNHVHAAEVAAKVATRSFASRGRELRQEFGSFLAGRNGVRGTFTFIGKMILRTPAIMPALVVGLFFMGVGAVAVDFAKTGSGLGFTEYAGHALVSVFAALLNMVILIINAVIFGVSAIFNVVFSGGLAVAQKVFDALFGALFGAVNHLIDLVPGISGKVEQPHVNPDAITTKTWFQLAYMVPTASLPSGIDPACGTGLVSWAVPAATTSGGPTQWKCVGSSPFVQYDVLVKKGASLFTWPASHLEFSFDDIVQTPGRVAGGLWDGVVNVWDNTVGRIHL